MGHLKRYGLYCYLTVVMCAISQGSLFGQAAGNPPPGANTRPADGVSVEAPHNAAVRPDEAIQLLGHLRVQGEVEAEITVTGPVHIGYYFFDAVFNPQTGEWEKQNRFVVVRPIGVSAVCPAGTYGGHGLYLDFEQWVQANPHWKNDTLYLCQGSPRDALDNVGSFAVGRLPSSFLPPWLAWLFQ